MLLHIPGVLGGDDLAECRAALRDAAWTDGRGTAGFLSAPVKHNAQLHWQDPVAIRLGELVRARLEQSPLFLSAALPAAILPPLFNRYAGGDYYGPHIDGALRPIDGTNRRIRTDLSITVMLSDPAGYDGGELVIEDLLGGRTIKLPAGDAIVYPANTIHEVTPVTRGERLAAFTWIQSVVRDDADRQLLFEFDAALQKLPSGAEADGARLQLTNLYHRLLRRWAEL
ncbi:Fe2+-dependent dioxygenase [Phenylobacterium sp.]|jgi:PKHD-type hydroxylase|uniref:Fe2+-dependent dioxygenase n=1 Tax=Phenylobacterium sp. TaxID=1871053 RepID=UPI002E31B28E|nr:Fe2+-dependent dioxygenase [Phenylobacterium sp.]HEX3367335.1 Fe2+-dependent dioxygenase [Phenylobacterium sp.]